MGDNVYLGDRNGVRTPMQWSADRNGGFSAANPHRLYLPLITEQGYHYESVNVETQAANPASLLSWMRQLIALRKRHPVLGRGTIEFLEPDNHHVLAFIRNMDGERPILCVSNLSRLAQHVELDLRAVAGATPIELFGRNRFGVVTDRPYPLTLAPHGFFWFELEGVERHPRTVRAACPTSPARGPRCCADPRRSTRSWLAGSRPVGGSRPRAPPCARCRSTRSSRSPIGSRWRWCGWRSTKATTTGTPCR